MTANNENQKISIALTQDEAVVLLEWLRRFNEEARNGLFQDQAEERVLFDLEAELERVVSITFSADYDKLLSLARERIRDKE